MQGVKNAVPKTILQLMNVDGMARENVASHLQKYRLYLKKLGGYPANAKTTPEALQQVQQVLVWGWKTLPGSSTLSVALPLDVAYVTSAREVLQQPQQTLVAA